MELALGSASSPELSELSEQPEQSLRYRYHFFGLAVLGRSWRECLRIPPRNESDNSLSHMVMFSRHFPFPSQGLNGYCFGLSYGWEFPSTAWAYCISKKFRIRRGSLWLPWGPVTLSFFYALGPILELILDLYSLIYTQLHNNLLYNKVLHKELLHENLLYRQPAAQLLVI